MIRKAEETTDIWGKEGGGGCLLVPFHFSLSFFPHDTGHQPNPKGKLSLGVGTSGVSPFFSPWDRYAYLQSYQEWGHKAIGADRFRRNKW